MCSAFLDKIWPVGRLTSHSQIATGGLNLVGPPYQIIQTYHKQPVGGWALAESAGGWKGGSVLWPAMFDKKSTFGGGLAIAKSQPAGKIHLACSVSLLNHTTNNPSVEVACKHGGGCGPFVPGGGPDHGGQLLPPCSVQMLEEACYKYVNKNMSMLRSGLRSL